MITAIETGPVRYRAAPVATGWCVYEGDVPIAYCAVETFARAIAQALNLARVFTIAGGRLLFIRPPADPKLN